MQSTDVFPGWKREERGKLLKFLQGVENFLFPEENNSGSLLLWGLSKVHVKAQLCRYLKQQWGFPLLIQLSLKKKKKKRDIVYKCEMLLVGKKN